VKAWEILHRKDAPALVILDWMMPGLDGPELCRRIRRKRDVFYQYILLVTAKDDKQDVVWGLEAGADDYLTKPFDLRELQARLEVGKRILTLQCELIKARERIQFQANHDGLTRVWNRSAILTLLDRELQRAARSRTSTGVLMMDLDFFKNINDQHGHLVGDSVLKEAARRIGLALRSYDFVGRYGGEEFLAVLPNCSRDDLGTIAERIRWEVAEAPITSQSARMSVTVSVGGVAISHPTSEMELLAAADAELYAAKRGGRNRVSIRR
jgi:diguanylate cyclase (GGDEF)-like protein